MIENDKNSIVAIIKKYIPHAIIYLFGSRARKDETPASDIDIAIDAGVKIEDGVISSIKDELENSNIPFKIDVVDLHDISPDLKMNIRTEGKQWS